MSTPGLLCRMVLGGSPGGLGGAQRVIRGIEARLARENWRTEWVSPTVLPHAPRSRRYPGLNEALRAAALGRTLARLPPATVTISHGMFGWGARGPRIHAAHGTSAGLAIACRSGLQWPDYVVTRWVNGAAERLSGWDAYRTAVSRRVRDEVRKHYGQSTDRTIHNGVDADHFRAPAARPDLRRRLGLPDDAFLLLLVGRMDYGKGREALVELLARLPEQFVAVLAAPEVAGADRLPAGRTICLGPVDYEGLPAVYGACDALLCISLYEGFGLTLLEGWAAGLPVLTHQVGVVDELLGRESAFDLLTSAVGDADGLAAATMRLQKEPELGTRQVAWGSELVHGELSLRRFQEEWWETVQSVLQ